MEFVLDNLLHVSVATFMKEDIVFAINTATSMSEQLITLDTHLWDMENYIEWNAKVDGYINNLKELIDELNSVQVIVAK